MNLKVIYNLLAKVIQAEELKVISIECWKTDFNPNNFKSHPFVNHKS